MKHIITFIRRAVTMAIVLTGIVVVVALFKPQEQTQKRFVLSLGKPYAVHTGLYNVPDTNSSLLVVSGTKSLVFSADVKGYVAPVISVKPFTVGTPRLLTQTGQLRADGAFHGYSAPGSVVVSSQGVCYFLHEEYWLMPTKPFPFASQINVWCTETGEAIPILTGTSNTKLDDNRVTGVGQPCTTVIDNQVYLFHTDWDSGLDAIHVARAPLKEITNPSAWKKYKDGSFSSAGLGGASDPVVLPAFEGDDYAASCSVSWNSYLSQYLMSYETRNALYTVRSNDGIDWTDPQLLLSFSQFGNAKVGYASLVSPTAEMGQTNQSGIVILSIRAASTLDTMMAIPFVFS